MKKFLLTSCYALALASVLPAAVINCATDQNINSGATTVNCPGVSATAGFTITGITLYGLGSWQDSQIPAFVGTSTYTFTENSAQFNAGPLVGVAAGSSTGSTGLLSDGPVAVSLASVLAFTVNVTRVINVGNVPNNATVTVNYETTETAIDTGIPEPATFALIGAGLLGAAILRRRK